MLVGPVDRGVHAHPPVDATVRVRVSLRGRQDLVPRPIAGETRVALPRGLPRPEPLGKITPRDPGPIPVNDPLDDLAMIPPRTRAARHLRHQRADHRPLLIRQLSTTIHDRTLQRRGGATKETRPSSRADPTPDLCPRDRLTTRRSGRAQERRSDKQLAQTGARTLLVIRNGCEIPVTTRAAKGGYLSAHRDRPASPFHVKHRDPWRPSSDQESGKMSTSALSGVRAR